MAAVPRLLDAKSLLWTELLHVQLQQRAGEACSWPAPSPLLGSAGNGTHLEAAQAIVRSRGQR